MSMLRGCGYLSVIGLLISGASAWADTGAWRSSNVQLLQGWDFQPEGQERSTLTVEHSQGNRYGSLFLFLDTYHRNDKSYDFYGEIYLQPSLTGLSGQAWQIGPLQDVSLSVGFNAGSDPKNDAYRAFLAGLRFDWQIPGFDWVQLQIHAYKNDEKPQTGVQITPVWNMPITLGSARLNFRGWLDWTSGAATGGGHWMVLTEPQLLLDVGHFFQHDDRWFIGMEYHHWEHMFGVKNLNESSAQIMTLFKF